MSWWATAKASRSVAPTPPLCPEDSSPAGEDSAGEAAVDSDEAPPEAGDAPHPS